ncbi:hypothetical protein CQW23_29357 [Capsicum baccatum]|uniref:CCHC-type domain-containing protein n=1 Tax=Capsicum baccatum TaxID=33114 RepID=A0A2G2VJ74_CAPBA|nr:hypothetical protein CQW23_29357 [Capsicum baccatum]
MRKYLNDMLKLNVSYSTMKRVKRLILEKLEGSYIDEFNKLEAYAQELRESNPTTDVIINISKEALNQGKRRAYFDTVSKNSACENNFTGSFNKWILNARGKPIIKMLEEIRTKVMVRLKELEEEGRNWKKKFSPYVMELYTDYNMITNCCEVKSNGYQGMRWLRTKIRMWCILKVDPARAMEPLEIQKMVDRPKVKRMREKAEFKKRERVWSASRKGLKMTCGHCGTPGHNQRKCPLLNKSKEPVQDVLVLAPRDSQESGVFMPTPRCVASSRQQTKSVGPELHVAPLSVAVVDTDGDESEEDDQPTMQPKRISEAKTRLEAKKVPHRPTGTRKIGFKRDENGASIPKNLSYSPKKLSYKGNAAITSNQLNVNEQVV